MQSAHLKVLPLPHTREYCAYQPLTPFPPLYLAAGFGLGVVLVSSQKSVHDAAWTCDSALMP